MIAGYFVANGTLDITSIFNRIVKQNAVSKAPEYEIIQPTSHSYWNFYWNGDYYWTYVVIKSSEELKETAPIKTSFPLRGAPVIIQQGQDDDGWYYYRVVLKTEKLNQFSESFEIDGRKPHVVTVYPEIVDVSGKTEVEIASVVIKDQVVLPAKVLPVGAFTIPLLSSLSKAMAVYVQNEGDNFEYQDVTVTIDGQSYPVLGVYVNGEEIQPGNIIYSGDIVGLILDIGTKSANELDGKTVTVSFNDGQLKDEKKINIAITKENILTELYRIDWIGVNTGETIYANQKTMQYESQDVILTLYQKKINDLYYPIVIVDKQSQQVYVFVVETTATIDKMLDVSETQDSITFDVGYKNCDNGLCIVKYKFDKTQHTLIIERAVKYITEKGSGVLDKTDNYYTIQWWSIDSTNKIDTFNIDLIDKDTLNLVKGYKIDVHYNSLSNIPAIVTVNGITVHSFDFTNKITDMLKYSRITDTNMYAVDIVDDSTLTATIHDVTIDLSEYSEYMFNNDRTELLFCGNDVYKLSNVDYWYDYSCYNNSIILHRNYIGDYIYVGAGYYPGVYTLYIDTSTNKVYKAYSYTTYSLDSTVYSRDVVFTKNSVFATKNHVFPITFNYDLRIYVFSRDYITDIIKEYTLITSIDDSIGFIQELTQDEITELGISYNIEKLSFTTSDIVSNSVIISTEESQNYILNSIIYSNTIIEEGNSMFEVYNALDVFSIQIQQISP